MRRLWSLPGRRAAERVIRAAGERGHGRRHSQVMGEIIKPVPAIGKPALIIVRRRGGLGSSAADVVIAHVRQAVAERHDPRDPIGPGLFAGKRDHPQHHHGHPCCFRRDCSSTIGSQTPFVND